MFDYLSFLPKMGIMIMTIKVYRNVRLFILFTKNDVNDDEGI